MKKESSEPCPIARSLTCVSDAWSVLILRDAGRNLTRFDQFRKSLGIAPTMLTSRLAALVEAGLLVKRQYLERPPRDEYILTDAGRDFLPVLYMMGEWARKHRSGGEMTRFFDIETGKEVSPAVIDLETGAKIGTRPIRIVEPERAL